MSQILNNLLNYFRLIFGGKYVASEDLTIIFKPSPLLLTGFILSSIAVVLIIVIFISYRNNLLNKKYLTVLAITTICLFITAGILFLFKDSAIKDQMADIARQQERPEEEIKEMLDKAIFGFGPTGAIFTVTQFAASVSLIGALLVEKFKKD